LTTRGTKKSARSMERNFIASLSHGLSVLEAVAGNSTDITLAALARRVGLKKTSTWRLAHTLVQLGYLHQDSNTRNFRPAPRVLGLGYAYFDGLDLKQLSLPFLHELSSRHDEVVILAVLDGDAVIYIERVRTAQIVTINLHVGSRLPLYNTSLGRALISEMPDAWVAQYVRRLDGDARARKYIADGGKKLLSLLRETRERGFALNDEEAVKGLRAIAAPIRGRNSEIVAAICISVPSSRVGVSDLKHTFAPDLIATAEKISLALGHSAKASQNGSDSGPAKHEFVGRPDR
jgi:IclR family pca regulon transcriptional regulator